MITTSEFNASDGLRLIPFHDIPTHDCLLQPNTHMLVPTLHMTDSTNVTHTRTYADIFLQLNIGSYVPTQQIHTRTLRLLHVETTEHRHILKTKHKPVCTNPTNTHTYQSEHRHIHTTKHRLICTNKTETHVYQQNLYALRTDCFGHTWRSPDHSAEG